MYVETLILDMQLQEVGCRADSIYFGGGTPSLMAEEHIFKVGEHLSINSPLQEWSIECSPVSVTAEKMEAFRRIGVTRVTLGVQSFDKEILKIIGRQQMLHQVFKAYDIIRDCGFKNVGIDLIFAIPGQSFKSWETDLKTAISLSPEHISTYNLTFEENSELNKRLREKQISALCATIEVEFFMRTGDILAQNGYNRYEVSNFSKPGFESVHNIHTWEMHDWIGYGPSASSQFGGKRFTNVPSLKLWREGILNGRHNRCDFQQLDEEILIQDSLIFGLRMTCGVNLQRLEKNFKNFDRMRYDNIFNFLVNSKLATFTENTLRLTTNGLLVADAIAVEILAA